MHAHDYIKTADVTDMKANSNRCPPTVSDPRLLSLASMQATRGATVLPLNCPGCRNLTHACRRDNSDFYATKPVISSLLAWRPDYNALDILQFITRDLFVHRIYNQAPCETMHGVTNFILVLTNLTQEACNYVITVIDHGLKLRLHKDYNSVQVSRLFTFAHRPLAHSLWIIITLNWSKFRPHKTNRSPEKFKGANVGSPSPHNYTNAQWTTARKYTNS